MDTAYLCAQWSSLVIVILLPKWRAWVFWIVQVIWLAEIPFLADATRERWVAWNELNLMLELVAVASTRRFPVARALMAAHLVVELYRWRVDCEWQVLKGPAYWYGEMLNFAAILALLAYSGLHIPTLWRNYVLRPERPLRPDAPPPTHPTREGT